MSNPLEWLLEQGTKYSDLIKTGTSVGMGVASFLDQKKKNELQKQAYDDYMRQVESAGQEARAAIDINYTPMVVSGVPTTKADVTDFTPVAKGGLMTLPNRQRKRYAQGPKIEEVMEIEDIEPTPFELQQETGIDLSGEQAAFPDMGNDKINAKNVWESGAIEQDNYIDFNEFFQSGDWRIHISEVAVEGDTQMASAPSGMSDAFDMYNDAIQNGTFDGTFDDFLDENERMWNKFGRANGGIAGLRHGGRIGYTGGGDFKNSLSKKLFNKPYDKLSVKEIEIFNNHISEEVRDKYGDEPFKHAQGGRIGYAQGSGIMNLGGLEKDYRTTGGFVPIGAYEKKDDVPARLSKNEFVMTADAVRAAGGGSINRGAQRMYDTMKNLEASPQSQRMIV